MYLLELLYLLFELLHAKYEARGRAMPLTGWRSTRTAAAPGEAFTSACLNLWRCRRRQTKTHRDTQIHKQKTAEKCREFRLPQAWKKLHPISGKLRARGHDPRRRIEWLGHPKGRRPDQTGPPSRAWRSACHQPPLPSRTEKSDLTTPTGDTPSIMDLGNPFAGIRTLAMGRARVQFF